MSLATREYRDLEARCQRRGRASRMLIVSFTLVLLASLLSSGLTYAQDSLARVVEKKNKELKEKEETLKQREERLNALQKDVEEKLDKYTKLLDQVERLLKKIEKNREERLDHIVKTYEAMPAEDAAQRLSVLDEQTAIKILMRMKSKKAAALMTFIEPKKAASFVEGITKIEKNFPTK